MERDKEKPATPEKQLLSIIEGPNSRSQLHAASIKYHGLSLFSLGALRGRIAFLKKFIKEDLKRRDLSQLELKGLNVILKLSVIVLAVYLIVNLSVSLVSLKSDLNFKVKITKSQIAGTSAVSSYLKEVTYYLEKARQRDIFAMGALKSPGGLAVTKGPSKRIIEATQNFRLVGIAWSNNPDIMIEDTKNQRTFFLKKGQLIENDIKLQAVFKDRVILSYGAEEIELR